MGVRNCGRCGRIFNYVAGRPICEVCRKELENQFQEVKAFIRENPDKGLREVSEECNVSEKQIKQWVREERLQFAKGSGVLSCDSCGAPIHVGRFCDNCKAKLTGNLNGIKADFDAKKQDEQASRSPKPTDSKASMRFIKG